MIGLEERLRAVDGVATIRVELGEEGVDAIKVEVVPGADEAGVLEEIRQVLVAYGLRSRKPGWKLGSRRTPPAIVAEVARVLEEPVARQDVFTLRHGGLPPIGDLSPNGSANEVRLDHGPPAALFDAPAAPAPTTEPAPVTPVEHPEVRVQQGGNGLVIVLAGSGKEVEASSDVSPIGAAEAMAKAVADYHGLERPDRVAVVMHELDGERVVTLLVRRGAESAVTVEVARPLLHEALYRATDRALRSLNAADSAFP